MAAGRRNAAASKGEKHLARHRDAVCRLCRREGQKLFLKGLRCFTEKCAIEKRNFVPGQHGQARRAKMVGYGVPLREPLNPTEPAEAQLTARPSGSVSVIMVLLNDAWMHTTPCGTTRFSFFLRNSFLRLAGLPGAAGAAPASCGSFATIVSSPAYSIRAQQAAPLRNLKQHSSQRPSVVHDHATSTVTCGPLPSS